MLCSVLKGLLNRPSIDRLVNGIRNTCCYEDCPYLGGTWYFRLVKYSAKADDIVMVVDVCPCCQVAASQTGSGIRSQNITG